MTLVCHGNRIPRPGVTTKRHARSAYVVSRLEAAGSAKSAQSSLFPRILSLPATCLFGLFMLLKRSIATDSGERSASMGVCVCAIDTHDFGA